MGFFSNIFGPKILPVFFQRGNDNTDASTLSDNEAIRIGAVYSCVKLISDTIGTLPVHIKQRENDSRITLYDHPIARLLDRPNPYMNGIDFRRVMMISCELRGNAYAYISKRDADYRPVRLDYVDPDTVSIFKGDDDLYYGIIGVEGLVPSRDVIHIKGFAPNGIIGKSPIALHREMLEQSQNSLQYSKNLYKNGLKTTGVFSMDKSLSKEKYDRLVEQLGKAYTGIRNFGRPLVLEDGMKFDAVTITPEDAQFINTRMMSIDEIASIFRVPPHKVGDLSHGTYSNNEQGNLEFYIDCIRPKLEILETELTNKLFTEEEYGRTYVDIDFKGLLRTDTATQTNAYQKLFYLGVLSSNDIRRMEDLPTYEGGDRYFVPVNMVENTAKPLKNDQDNDS